MHKKHDAYGSVAKYYDMLVQPFLGRMRAQVTGLCCEMKAQRVLDICCGTGKQIENMQKAGLTAMGVDISQGMLRVARDVNQGRVIYGDANNLPFGNASFDICTVSLALHEMPLHCAENLIHEALRISHFLLIIDYSMAERNIEYPAVGLAFLVERLVGGEHYKNYAIFMRQGAVEGLVTRLGLHTVVRHKVWGGAGVLHLIRKDHEVIL